MYEFLQFIMRLMMVTALFFFYIGKVFEENRAFTLAIGSMVVSGIFLFGMFANKFPLLFQVLIILSGVGAAVFMFWFDQMNKKNREGLKKKTEEKGKDEKEKIEDVEKKECTRTAGKNQE